MIRRLLFLLLLSFLPVSVGAQSLLSGSGLGLLAEPFDARTRALGVPGSGLVGWHLLSHDPGAAGGVSLPSISFTLQSAAAKVSGGQVSGQTRFPQIGLSYPLGWNVFFLELGSYLGQEWRAERLNYVSIGGTAVGVTDTYSSTGGIGRLQLGWSRRLFEPLSVGVSVGQYLGSLSHTFRREFSGSPVGQVVDPFENSAAWRASGSIVGFGAVYDPSPILRISGAVTWSGDLTLTPIEGSEVSGGSYTMPLEVRGGGSLTLIPGVTLVAGGSYADWSETRDDLATDNPEEGASLSFGGGVELSNFSLIGKQLPLRLGARHTDLPFAILAGGGSERTLSAGIGGHLVEGPDFPLARFDLGLERGTRNGGFDPEPFWRLSLSLSVSGS